MRTNVTAWKNARYCLKSGQTCLNISDFKYLAIVFELYLDFLQLCGCVSFDCNRDRFSDKTQRMTIVWLIKTTQVNQS